MGQVKARILTEQAERAHSQKYEQLLQDFFENRERRPFDLLNFFDYYGRLRNLNEQDEADQSKRIMSDLNTLFEGAKGPRGRYIVCADGPAAAE